LRGHRGEILLTVRLEYFGDANPFKDSSAGVFFFSTSIIPPGLVLGSVLGFVEELVLESDPEYHWSDKIRSTRASNETRQKKMFELTGTVKKLFGKKVLEMGGNAVLGFRLSFDLEKEEGGIVARGIGVACKLLHQQAAASEFPELFASLPQNQGLASLEGAELINSPDQFPKEPLSSITPSPPKPFTEGKYRYGSLGKLFDSSNPESRKNSDERELRGEERAREDEREDLSKPHSPQNRGQPIASSPGQDSGGGYFSLGNDQNGSHSHVVGTPEGGIPLPSQIKPSKRTQANYSTDIQLYTIDTFYEGQILNFGGIVSARSVKVSPFFSFLFFSFLFFSFLFFSFKSMSKKRLKFNPIKIKTKR